MIGRRLALRLARVVVGCKLLFILAAGCATEPENERPVPGGDRTASGLEYIYPVPPAKAYDAVLAAFQSVFGKTIASTEKENPEKLAQYRMYGEVRTDYLYYEENGKKYRKQCNAYVHLMPGYANYSDVSVSCQYDAYVFGFARGGIHNLFSQWWWDWYPEVRVYAAEDMLELIREKLGLGQEDVIRLSSTLDDRVSAIKAYEAKKKAR